MCQYFGKLSVSTANGFVKLSELYLCASRFINLFLNLYFSCCILTLLVNAVLFEAFYCSMHIHDCLVCVLPVSHSGIRGTEILCYISQKRQVASVFILKLQNNISLAGHETGTSLTHLTESGLCFFFYFV